MENSPKSGFPWNFTTVLTKDGYRYVKAYRMKWDPVLKKSKRCLQRHVGRLFEDGRIKISPKFSADFPEYAGDPGNEKADALANLGVEAARGERPEKLS